MTNKIVTIKWKTGQMELSVRDFLDIIPDLAKIRKMADLAKRSDRDFHTDTVAEMLIYCSQLIDSQKASAEDWEYRRKTSSFVRVIERFIQQLSEPLPKTYKAKRLF